jgi:hypothetical protein
MRCVVLAFVLLSSPAFGQTPQPFPRAGEQPRTQRPADPPVNTGSTAQQPTSKPIAQPTTQAPPALPPAAQIPGAKAPVDPTAPAAAVVWFPVYPSAQFLASYDAGRNQRYYLYGTTAPFADIVAYYRTQLDEKGNQVFREPPTHMFEVGRFREETMAFPPGVTIKDWTWGGSQGYPNPRRGVQPARFPTIIMIVPPPPVAPAAAPVR